MPNPDGCNFRCLPRYLLVDTADASHVWTTRHAQVLSLRLGHACFCQHYSMNWTAAGETVTGDGSRLRGSKRLKTTTPATSQGPQHGQRCNPKPTRNQSMMKAPCKRSQKLGDKITALQQLVSPYGKDTGEEDGGVMDLRRRGLCVAPLSPTVVQLVSAEAACRHRDAAFTEDHWRCLGTL
ncbi:unnamed protein product [Miscanthus lutarioriparius]|uniref:Uncharacterized protein n=1 Tax=Miscanthus lutarioriparius TaxID=422564 RepID=A0A811R4I0_9POAL|nr:unnamed protein product [Miscanthus lutarioriparius]